LRTPSLTQGSPREIAVPSEGIRVAVWNLHKETGPLMIRELREWIESNRADVVALQEFSLSPEDSLVSALGGRTWTFSANLEDAKTSRRSGVLTASSHACHDPVAALSKGTEPIAGTPKPMLFLRCVVGLDTISIANLHGLNFSPFLGAYREQLGQVLQFVQASPGAAIVAGDFNTWTARKLDLTDSVFHSAGLVRLDFGKQAADIESVLGNPIDHIYYTPASLAPDTASLRVDRQFLSSDHRALFAVFRLGSR